LRRRRRAPKASLHAPPGRVDRPHETPRGWTPPAPASPNPKVRKDPEYFGDFTIDLRQPRARLFSHRLPVFH
jgi:hypothetical protein